LQVAQANANTENCKRAVDVPPSPSKANANNSIKVQTPTTKRVALSDRNIHHFEILPTLISTFSFVTTHGRPLHNQKGLHFDYALLKNNGIF